MTKSIRDLKNRVVKKDEVLEKSNKTKRVLDLEELFGLFVDLQIGEAREFDGFDSETEGKNFLSYNMPDVLKRLRKECGWGKNDKGEDYTDAKGKLVRVTTTEVHPGTDGKVAMWVIRVK